ncbi:MAG: hypothetical protein ABIN48_07220 [Ginsengibacter sp.]
MKRLVAFLLLISHMNTSMFLPQVPQDDVFDEHGNQLDDLNSIVEVIMVYLGIDDVADDEDADNGQNFNMANPPCITPPYSSEINNPLIDEKDINYSISSKSVIALMAYDVILPPPKIASHFHHFYRHS